MTNETLNTITLDRHSRVAVIALNRPQVMNAINLQMRAELRTTLDALRHDAGIGAVVLTANGDKAFCAGMDLREFASLNAELPVSELKRFRWEQSEGIAAFDKPIIAAVNGMALGGGVEIALLCDLIFAAEHASFAFAEIRRGIMPGNGGTQRLSRRVGIARALEMILTGGTYDAAAAERFGLVNGVFEPAELTAKVRAVAAGLLSKGPIALALAEAMAANAPVAVRTAKAAVRRGAELPLEQGIRLEQDLAAFLYTTEDAKEGPSAFLEKRPPVWQGR